MKNLLNLPHTHAVLATFLTVTGVPIKTFKIHFSLPIVCTIVNTNNQSKSAALWERRSSLALNGAT
jgi:hypothetical protein